MRIGIVPALNRSGGGLYQHSLNILHALESWRTAGWQDEFVIFVDNLNHPLVASLRGMGWEIRSIHPSLLKRRLIDKLRRVVEKRLQRKVWQWLRHSLQHPDPEKPRFNAQMSQHFRKYGIELMLYTFPTKISFEIGIPYVTFIMDLQHRLQPYLPEVSADGQWEQREYLFRNTIRCATLLFVDSETGKEDILTFYGTYGATPDRIKILPYLPPYYLAPHRSEAEKCRVQEKYRLPERYLFYPAQFWPHKNHAVIIQALERLKRVHGLEIPVVFCGSHTGKVREEYFQLVMNMARYCGVVEQVHYLGYVPDEDMTGLYAGAVALVMPTLFGPANIPYLEAWTLKCPVLTSDIRGIREQVGEAGILVDPRSVEAIADGIRRLWLDENLRRALIERGQQRVASFTFDDYRKRLIEILEEAKARVRSGKSTNHIS
jgi:glycosyltransferase involved in cell wall biosynthesis